MLLAYEDALAKILELTVPLTRRERVALGGGGPVRVLTESVFASGSHPRFDNASVDGYAVHGDDLRRVGERLPVVMTVAAGEEPHQPLESGAAARIFTGAKLPLGTAAVAMQEYVVADGAFVALEEPLTEGEGFRRAGADFAKSDLLLYAGTPITPGVSGLLASQGVVTPTVFALPNALFVTTGDEIVSPDLEPGQNQLRDSIGSMLGQAAVKYSVPKTGFAPDDPSKLRPVIAEAVETSDVVFVAGGASVGDRDFVAGVVGALGKVEFHGINVRPGKPLLFGQIAGKPILCLPGNPASAYVCFQLFGVPLLRRLGGWSSPELLWFSAPYDADHELEPRDVFSRVTLTGGRATPVFEQASFGLRSLGAAQALARLPGGKRVRSGDQVAITLLDV